jgi:hypothetical protein
MFFSLNFGMNFNLHHHLLFIGELGLDYLGAQVYFMATSFLPSNFLLDQVILLAKQQNLTNMTKLSW